jgi:nicotinamidase-related amidase
MEEEMIKMPFALINIDYTIDFVAEYGSLTCGKPAKEIERYISEITRKSAIDGNYIVFAVDCHNENDRFHPEQSLYPPHNIRNTKGRRLYGHLYDIYNNINGNDNVYFMDKTRYSAFAGTDLEIKLRERGITEVRLCGVCTDICVLHTAIDAYNRGFKVVIYKDAVASFNELGHQWAIEHFKFTLNALII